MKKFLFSFIIFLLHFISYSQLTFQIGNVTGNKGDTVLVPVTVASGFNNIYGIQYTMTYDSNVLAILIPDSLTIIKTSDFLMSYGTYSGSSKLKNGEIAVQWDAGGNPKSLNNGTLLYTIRFRLIGKECDSSFVKISNSPNDFTKNEYLDGNFNTGTVLANNGLAKINGSGCVVTPPPSGLEFIASQDTSPKGIVKCIKITTKNFKNLTTFQFALKWNRAVALYNSVAPAPALVPNNNFQGAPFPDSSGVRVLWGYDPLAGPLSLPDGTTIFSVCLTPVGNPGTSTPISFGDDGGFTVEIIDNNGNTVTPTFTSGKLTVADAPAQTLKLYIRDTTVNACGEFCFPVRVDNFTCVDAFEFRMNYDTSKLKLSRIPLSLANLPEIKASDFNVDSNFIKVSWSSSSGVTRKNGDSLFVICFTSKLTSSPDCPFSTKFTFADLSPGSPLEFSDCNSNNFTVIKGEPTINVNCCPAITPPVPQLGDSISVKCYGDCNGSIINNKVKQNTGSGNFKFEWLYVPTSDIVSNDLNPTGLCAGDYILIVTDLGNANLVVQSRKITILSPTAMNATAVITHEQVNFDGKIVVTDTGGTPPYKYAWTRIIPPPIKKYSTKDLMNLQPGTYVDSITDANGCLLVDTFIVNPAPIRFFSFTQTVFNKCFGDCSAVVYANAAKGYPPYRYKWSTNANDTMDHVNSLCAGIYSVTITDQSGAFVTGKDTILQPDKIDITADSIVKASCDTCKDGKIYLTIKGGTPFKKNGPPYTYQWKDSTGAVIYSQEDFLTAKRGNYTICVKDSLNCEICAGPFTVMSMGGGGNPNPPVITVGLSIIQYPGGRSVSCHGKCDGKMVVSVTSTDPKLPYKYKWSHDPNLKDSIATNLCPNISYSVTVTDNAGNTKISSTLLLTDAPVITLSTSKIKCASTNNSTDGSYEAVVSGGVLPLTYLWCNNETAQTALNLSAGNCNVQVTDANGCTDSESFLVCLQNAPPPPTADCYTGRSAISPNGDGLNDVLLIACATDHDNYLNIYDRWGNIVYGKANYANDWNGINLSGENLTEGTYMWVLKVKQSGKDDVYYKGTVTIVR